MINTYLTITSDHTRPPSALASEQHGAAQPWLAQGTLLALGLRPSTLHVCSTSGRGVSPLQEGEVSPAALVCPTVLGHTQRLRGLCLQVACLARCNGAQVSTHFSGTFSVDEFREQVRGGGGGFLLFSWARDSVELLVLPCLRVLRVSRWVGWRLRLWEDGDGNGEGGGGGGTAGAVGAVVGDAQCEGGAHLARATSLLSGVL